MNGQRNNPKPICPFNFFEVGGITMMYITINVQVVFNLAQFRTILSFDLQI